MAKPSSASTSLHHRLGPDGAGRDAELRQFEILVGRLKRGSSEQSMIVKGLRGVGKTVLLKYHELTPESVLAAEIARDSEKALTRLSLSSSPKPSGPDNLARTRKRGVVFLLDEVQFADEVHFRAMISALHRVTQRNLPITVAAAGLPQIPRLTGEARSYRQPRRGGCHGSADGAGPPTGG